MAKRKENSAPKSEIQFEFYTPKKKAAPPSATVTSQLITLKNVGEIFAADSSVAIAYGTDNVNSYVLITEAGSQPDAASFKCKVNANGNIAIKCRAFVQDVIVGECKVQLPNKKGVKCEAVEIDQDAKTVKIKVK